MKDVESDWPDYETLEHRLFAASTPFSPAYIHGMMVAMLCVSSRSTDKTWTYLQAEMPTMAEQSTTNKLFEALFRLTTNQLQDPDKGVVIMLPIDGEPLSHRLEALSSWCEGFLDGVTLENVSSSLSQLPLVTEVLSDLQNIKDISFDARETEENEKNYAEIVEFIRVGLLLVYAECKQANIAHQPLH